MMLFLYAAVLSLISGHEMTPTDHDEYEMFSEYYFDRAFHILYGKVAENLDNRKFNAFNKMIGDLKQLSLGLCESGFQNLILESLKNDIEVLISLKISFVCGAFTIII